MPPVFHPLACHPVARPVAARTVSAAVAGTPEGGLALRFVLTGELAAIAVPAACAPRRADGLWRHTCFECFVAAGAGAYLEFNFSPSGEWAAYAFRGYRDAAPLPAAHEPHITVKQRAGALELTAALPAAALPASAPSERRRLGLSAVIEEQSGLTTYWALRHAPGKPDFHHACAFALEV